MKRWILPADRLMGSFSYRTKFLLISLLSLAPAVVMTADILFKLSARLDEATQAQRELSRLHSLSRLIPPLETLRDLGVRHFLMASDVETKAYEQASAQIQNQLDQFRLHEVLLTRKLETALEANTLPPGSEGFRISQIFDNANRAVEVVHEQSRELASEGVLGRDPLPGTSAVINLLTRDLARLTRAMGAARSLGAYYLGFPYLDSSGATQVDSAYYTLDYETKQLALTLQQDELRAYGMLHDPQRVIDAASAVQHDLDASLIQVVDLDTPWFDYYQRTSLHMGRIYDFIDAEYRELQTQVRAEYGLRQRSLIMTGALLLLVCAGYFYLLSGLYSNVRSTVQHLSESAHRIAQGDYDSPVVLRAQDETQEIARALESMRVILSQRDQLLREFSLTDGLTGLRNRTYFDEALASSFARAQRHKTPLSLLMIDADLFKQVNDKYGHLVGDHVLQHLSQMMRQIIQRESDVVARYGGEEFVVLLPDTELFEARVLAERLRGHIETHPFVENGAALKITVSIGVASIDHDTSAASGSALIQRADEALYAAKRQGRNQVQTHQFSHSMTTVPPA